MQQELTLKVLSRSMMHPFTIAFFINFSCSSVQQITAGGFCRFVVMTSLIKGLPLNLFNTFKISSATLADLMFSGLSFFICIIFGIVNNSWIKNRVRICFVHLPPNFVGGLLFFRPSLIAVFC